MLSKDLVTGSDTAMVAAVTKCPFPWLQWNVLGSRAGGRASHPAVLRSVVPLKTEGRGAQRAEVGVSPGWPQLVKKTWLLLHQAGCPP